MFLQKYYQIVVEVIVIFQRINIILQLMVSGKVEAGDLYNECQDVLKESQTILLYTNVKVHSYVLC
jgi:hypothetical protein